MPQPNQPNAAPPTAGFRLQQPPYGSQGLEAAAPSHPHARPAPQQAAFTNNPGPQGLPEQGAPYPPPQTAGPGEWTDRSGQPITPGRMRSPEMQNGLMALGASLSADFLFNLAAKIASIGAPFALAFIQEVLDELKSGELLSSPESAQRR